MARYIFSGKILPERATLTLPTVNRTIGAEDTDFEGKITVTIIMSQVNAVLDTKSPLSVTDFKNVVENFVYTMVDVYGYLKGYAYTVEIVSVFVSETGYSEVFGIDVVKITKDEFNRPLNYNDTLQLALRTPQLYTTLQDLREAMKKPLNTSFHCTRAVEGIKQYFSDSWENMRDSLSISEKNLKEITNAGKKTRHGAFRSISGDERVDLMTKTWKVVDKFIEYLKSQEDKKPD